MNFIFAIIDSIVEWIKRNPLTCILLVMIAVFAPSLFGAIFIGIAIVALLLLALPIYGLFKLHRMSKNMEQEARQQGFGGFNTHQNTSSRPKNEGEVKVYATAEANEKRVNDEVGEYVDFEEVKDKKQ